MGYSDFSEER